jgi:hypothetical protein
MNSTNLCEVLPNFLLIFTLSFPLLTNNFGNVRIIQARIAGDDGLLMVLPIKNKRYKESAAGQDVRKQELMAFVHSKSYGPISEDDLGDKE